MLFNAWLRSWKSGRMSHRRLARSGRRTAEVGRLGTVQRAELLEDRALLSTITVNTVQDVLDGNTQSIESLLNSPGADGKISLREAITAANHGDKTPSLQQISDGFRGTTITFDPALTANGDAAISLTQFDVADERPREVLTTSVFQPMSEFGPTAFMINSSIEILGPMGDNGITIQRAANAPDFRLFQVQNWASLALVNLTLAGGVARGGDGASGGGGAAGLGGAILNEGSLTIQNSTLMNSQAIGGNGSVQVSDFSGGGGGGGLGTDGQQPMAIDGGNGGAPNGGAGGLGDRDQGQGDFLGSPGEAGGVGGGGGGGGAGGNGGGDGGNGGFGGGGGGGSASPIFPPGDHNRGGAGGFGGGGGSAGSSGSGYPNVVVVGGGGGFGGGKGGDTVNAGSGVQIADGGGGAGLGGAIFNLGGYVQVINSTASGNTAQGGLGANGSGGDAAGTNGSGLGGGLFNLNGAVYLTNATIANNTALQGGGAVYNLSHESANGLEYASTNSAFLSLRNSILADSNGPNDLVLEKR